MLRELDELEGAGREGWELTGGGDGRTLGAGVELKDRDGIGAGAGW